MIDADFVNAIQALTQRADTQPVTQDVPLEDGQTYTYRNNATEHGRALGDMIVPPKPACLTVSTLTGFRDGVVASKASPDKYLIHVEDYLNVSLKLSNLDHWGQRATVITAKHTPLNIFSYGTYYSDLQKFIIQLQAAFLTTDDLLYVIRLASNLKAGNSVQSQDDGFSQTVVVQTGEVSTAEIKVRPRVKLIPVRTFPEAAPVESEFLIRFQQNDKAAPSVALFDVSGNVWVGQLMQSIKTWLARELPGFAIIA